MEPSTLVVLATVPAVLGLVTIAKDLGLPAKYSPLMAIGVGIVLSVFDVVSRGGTFAHDAPQAVATGLILGLSASGLYDGARAIGTKSQSD